MKYLPLLLYIPIALLQILRIVKLIFNPSIFNYKIFDFPQRKTAILGYYLCALVILLIAILDKFGI